MLQKFIKNIKAKPEPVRKSITLGASLGITGIVGFFWLISFLNYSSEVLLAKPKTESPTSFLNKMGSLIGESYANVRSKIDDTNSFVDDTNVDNENLKNVGVGGGVDVEISSTTPDSETISTTTSNTIADIEIVATTTTNVKPVNSSTSDKTSNGVSLQDILTTKKKDNQENKATTSSEVLVQ